MSISLNGLASKLDTGAMIEQLMLLERLPLEKMEKRLASVSSEQSFFRTINTKLNTLKYAAADLNLPSTFKQTSAVSSNSNAVKITAGNSAVTGNYDISITNLAKSHVTSSTDQTSGAAYAGPFGKIVINHPELSSPLEIQITNTPDLKIDDVLNTIKDGINANAKGLTASVVETTPGNKKLVFTSSKSGTDHSIAFGAGTGNRAVISDTDGILAGIGLDGSNTVQAAGNAEFKVNGLNVIKGSNEVTDVISGATINLLAVGDSTVSVNRDAEKVYDKVKAFADAYNDIVKTIRANTAKGAALQGDSTLRNLESRLNQWATSIAGGTVKGYHSLADIGIEIDKGVTVGKEMTGTMNIDKAKFIDKFNGNPEAVTSLFGFDDADDPLNPSDNQDGIARLMNQGLEGWTKTVDGILSSRLKGYDSDLAVINDKIDRMNSSLLMKQDQLKRQFTAMEVSLTNLQNQQKWLSGQFAALTTSLSSK